MSKQVELVRATAPVAVPLAAHLSAATLYDMRLPTLPTWLPSLVVLPPQTLRPERSGVYAFRSRAALGEGRMVGGRPVVTAAACVGQLAEDLAILDLVIAIDGALYDGLCTMDEITATMRRRQRGLPTLRAALDLCDGRSESPWETLLRVLLVTSGICVEPQAPICDIAGSQIARADLKISGTRRLSEYDGAGHRERDRHQQDLAREKALARAGWQRYGYTASEIMGCPAQVLRDAEDALGWPHDETRLATWLRLVKASSFTPGGRSLLAKRLQRFTKPLRGRKPRPSS